MPSDRTMELTRLRIGIQSGAQATWDLAQVLAVLSGAVLRGVRAGLSPPSLSP